MQGAAEFCQKYERRRNMSGGGCTNLILRRGEMGGMGHFGALAGPIHPTS